MHQRIIEVVNYLDSTRENLAKTIETVSADRRNERPAPESWSVAEVLDHLNQIENRISQSMAGWLAQARAAGIGEEVDTSAVIDSINRGRILDRTTRATAPGFIRPRADVDADDVWRALQASRAQLCATFETGDGLALSEIIQPHPVLGPINLYQWMLFVGAHEARHTEQIREIGEQFSAKTARASE